MSANPLDFVLSPSATELLERLMASPPFDRIEEESSRDALRYEAGLFFGAQTASPPRPSYLAFSDLDAETAVVNQGDLTTEFYAILSGTVAERHAEVNAGSRDVAALGAGDWFGEVSALSDQPSPTSLTTSAPTQLATLDARLFTKLYGEDEGFKAAIDERYRERSLAVQLQTAPLFAGLDLADIEALRNHVEFLTLDKGETIAGTGEPADAFFLVRSGGVQCSVTDDQGAVHVASYYMANSSFGEHAMMTHAAHWPASFETIERTDLIRIPRDRFLTLLETHGDAYRAVTHAANLIVGEDEESLATLYDSAGGRSRRQRIAADELEVMVHKKSFKGGFALVIDKGKCIRCNVCVESCVSVHKDGVPRISKTGTRTAADEMLITSCYNCSSPGCMKSCAYGAIRRDRQGTIRFVTENCVGCTKCVDGCPYGVIKMAEPQLPEPVRTAGGWFGKLPILGRWFGPAEAPAEAREPEGKTSVTNIGGEPAEVDGKAIKCDLCHGLPFEACVYNCPTEAIRRRGPESLFRVAGP